MTLEKHTMKYIGVGFNFAFMALAAGCATSGRDVPDAPDVVAIQQTARSGDLSRLQRLLEDDPTLANAARNRDHKTPLHWAAYFGHTQAVTLLLEYGAQIDAKDSFGIVPLREAAYAGHTEIVKILIDRGSDVNSIDRQRISILDAASYGAHCDIAALLLERGAAVNGGYSDFFPIDTFVYIGDAECTRKFIAHGAKVNDRNINGSTRAHWLAKGTFVSKEEKFTVEIYTGREVQTPSPTGPKRYQDIFDMLVAKGADLNARNNLKETPLHICAASNNLVIAKALIAAGVDINARERYQRTPLFFAVENGNTEFVRLLLSKKAKVNVRDHVGFPPLIDAIRSGKQKNKIAKIVQLLIDGDADVNARTPGGGWGRAGSDGLTALQQAARFGHTDVVELLIRSGANVNAEFKDGRTPLYSAARFGRKDIVEILIRNGANVNAEASGRSALMAARQEGRSEVVELLVKYGAKE